jgi:streptogramin lyase
MVYISKSRFERSQAETAALEETSPFQNPNEHKVRMFRSPGQAHHMGSVHTAGGQIFFIRIKCQHMAEVDHVDAIDCRYGCEAKAIAEREREQEARRRYRA